MKKFSKLIACMLAIMMLVGITATMASANEPVTITFINPLAEIEPVDNMPIASRAPLRGKLERGEQVNFLALYYSKMNNVEIAVGIAEAVRVELWNMYGDNFRNHSTTPITEMTEAITITLAAGGTTLYSNVDNQPPQGSGATTLLPYYWKNQGPINPDTGWPEGRVPFMGSPWGPKTGFGYTGFPSYEQNFERYAQWASFDAVMFAYGD
ncbi:MAG: hypothetical protein FWC75_06995 [Oscillospiraceae bacterium]|nr:hypothetical protein [Oscillospiraceae bacterium]